GGQLLEVTTHPTSSIFAAALINGEAVSLDSPEEEGDELFRIKEHKKSCRSLDFSMDGSVLYSASRDRTWMALDVSTGKVLHHELQSHEKGINRIRCLNDRIFATGDDQGVVKIWDQRSHKEVQSYHDNEDFISNFAFQAQKKQLLAAGGDGYLSVFDIRKPNLVARSDNLDDELLSVQIIKNGKKAVVGTQDGVLAFFNYGDWGDINDRFVGHPSSVDALCKVDEDTVLSGSSDGMIRVCGLLPNRMYGIVGAQDMPVECLTLDHSRQWLLSLGHDALVRFWDVNFLTNEEVVDEEEEEEEEKEKEEREGSGAAHPSPNNEVSGKKRVADEVEEDIKSLEPPKPFMSNKKKRKAARQEAKEQAKKDIQDKGSFFSDL
ncbi:MAG: WD40-repeat-containing domain protein, partial [Piptocephalis tieghemiana]